GTYGTYRTHRKQSRSGPTGPICPMTVAGHLACSGMRIVRGAIEGENRGDAGMRYALPARGGFGGVREGAAPAGAAGLPALLRARIYAGVHGCAAGDGRRGPAALGDGGVSSAVRGFLARD